MGFRDIFGHSSAIRALRRAIEADSLPGTYLITGPPGVGKTALARAFADSAACLVPALDPFDACGTCESCRIGRGGAHPDISIIAPATDQTQIWQFWDRDGRPPGALQHSLRYAPSIGRRKIFIIERAETLTDGAANSLLKVLEEPPPYVVFVLLAPNAARMIPTIQSRSQLIRLASESKSELAGYLTKAAGITADRAIALAAYAEGRTGTALNLARGRGVEAEIATILDLADSLANGEALGALKLAERIRKHAAGIKALASIDSAVPAAASQPEQADDSDIAPKERAGRRPLGIVLELITAYYRDLLAARLADDCESLIHLDRTAEIRKTAKSKEPMCWARCIENLIKARRRIEQNANTRLVTDLLAVQLVTAH